MNPHSSTRGRAAIDRRRFLAGGAAALTVAAAGVPGRARAQAKPGGTLTFASTALPPSIEPHMQGLDIWQRRKPLLYENLVWIDYALEPKPELAERWEQKSPTEYVFHLRRAVRFHNGKEMDAEDVKYSYERIRDPKVSPGANDLTFVSQIDTCRHLPGEPGRQVQRRHPEGRWRRRQGAPHRRGRHRALRAR